MPNTVREKIILTDVPADKLQERLAWAKSLGGKVIAVEQEPDGEFTVIILI